MDRRAEAEVAGIDSSYMRERTGLVLDSTHMAAKIRWSARNLPATRKAALWHQPVSFVVAALCGRAVMDHALASTTMLYGLRERDYAADLLAAFDIDRNTLPAVDDACATAGSLTSAGSELTGLDVGTPVAVGTGDDFSNAIGAAVTTPGFVAATIGTAEAIGAAKLAQEAGGSLFGLRDGYISVVG